MYSFIFQRFGWFPRTVIFTQCEKLQKVVEVSNIYILHHDAKNSQLAQLRTYVNVRDGGVGRKERKKHSKRETDLNS